VSKTNREGLITLAYVVAGLIAVFVVGYLSFQQRFFGFPRPMLPFLVVGLTGSLMYVLVQMRKAGLAVLMILLLLLTQVAMAPPIRPASLAASAMFAIPVGFAILGGVYAQKSLVRLKFGRFVVMGIVVAAGYGAMMLLWLIRSHTDVRVDLLARQALVGFELGAAMGLGFELVDLFGPRPKPKLAAKRPPM
jgi:hypothetical protein